MKLMRRLLSLGLALVVLGSLPGVSNAQVRPASRAATGAPAADAPTTGASDTPGVPLPSISITSPSGPTTTGEGDDFTSAFWGNSWDMHQVTDLYLAASPPCGTPRRYGPSNWDLTNGIWSAMVELWPAPIWLMNPAFASNTLPLGNDGQFKPVDAGRYTRLSFRMKIDYAPGGSLGRGRIRYTDGSFDNQADPNHWAWSKQFLIYPDNQWHVYVLDMPTLAPGEGLLTWTPGKWMTGIGIDPGVNPGATVSLDWVRLSDETPVRHVAWSGSYLPDATVQLELGASTGGPFDDVHVFDPGLINPNGYFEPTPILALPGTYDLITGLQVGTQYVRAKVTDVTGTGTSAPAGPFNVDAAAWGNFTVPGPLAGVDWITSEGTDAWDMDRALHHDVNTTNDIATSEYIVDPDIPGNDLYHAQSNNHGSNCGIFSDPYVQLRMFQSTIDTSRFHWLTFRMNVTGAPDIGLGWVARVSWGNDWSTRDCGESNDIIVYEGWNTYTVDLKRSDVMEPGSICTHRWTEDNWAHLRIDPFEQPPATWFWLDYVYLSDDITASPLVTLRWTQVGATGQSTTQSLYYDTDDNPANGKTLIVGGLAPGAPERPAAWPFAASPLRCLQPSCVYLPLLQYTFVEPPPIPCESGSCSYLWDTSAVPNGTYYVYILTSDGYSTIGRYSDTPVVVSH